MSANNICLLIFDSTVNLEPMRCIFEKGLYNSNIIGVPSLGDAVKKSLGFPSICIGFKNRVKENTGDLKSHFYPVVEFVNSFVQTHNKVSKSICDIVSKEEKITESNQTNDHDKIASKNLSFFFLCAHAGISRQLNNLLNPYLSRFSHFESKATLKDRQKN